MCADARASSGRKRRLPNLWRRPLLRSFGAAGGGQLQHCGTLALAQAREQHHLAVREFHSIVMGHGVVHVDLPEACEPLSDLLVRENADAERRLAFDILVERNLGAGQQTDRNMRLPDRGEAAGDRSAGASQRRGTLIPRGRRPSMAASTRSGASKDRDRHVDLGTAGMTVDDDFQNHRLPRCRDSDFPLRALNGSQRGRSSPTSSSLIGSVPEPIFVEWWNARSGSTSRAARWRAALWRGKRGQACSDAR